MYSFIGIWNVLNTFCNILPAWHFSQEWVTVAWNNAYSTRYILLLDDICISFLIRKAGFEKHRIWTTLNSMAVWFALFSSKKNFLWQEKQDGRFREEFIMCMKIGWKRSSYEFPVCLHRISFFTRRQRQHESMHDYWFSLSIPTCFKSLTKPEK